MEWLTSRIDAKIVLESHRRHYHHVRSYSNPGRATPIEFKKQLSLINNLEPIISQGINGPRNASTSVS